MFPYTENTQNPNPIFKITIYCTKYTNNAKIHSKIWKILNKSKVSKFYFVICIASIVHILYVLNFCKFCNFFARLDLNARLPG